MTKHVPPAMPAESFRSAVQAVLDYCAQKLSEDVSDGLDQQRIARDLFCYCALLREDMDKVLRGAWKEAPEG